MNLSARDYAIGAFCEAATNQLDHKIMWAAITGALSPDAQRTDCKALDENVQAAIHARDWLKSLTEAGNPRGT